METEFVSINAPQWQTPHGEMQIKANAILNFALQALGAFNYYLESGNLPDGISLTDTGTLSGICQKPGTFDFIICACNGVSRSMRSFSICVQA